MQATDSSATLVINRQMSCVFALPLLRKLVGPVAVPKHRPSTPFPSRPVTPLSLRHRLGPVFSSAIFVSVKTTRSFALLLVVLDQWTGGSLIPIPACPVYSGLCPPIPAAPTLLTALCTSSSAFHFLPVATRAFVSLANSSADSLSPKDSYLNYPDQSSPPCGWKVSRINPDLSLTVINVWCCITGLTSLTFSLKIGSRFFT